MNVLHKSRALIKVAVFKFMNKVFQVFIFLDKQKHGIQKTALRTAQSAYCNLSLLKKSGLFKPGLPANRFSCLTLQKLQM